MHHMDADGSLWTLGTYAMWGGSLRRLHDGTSEPVGEAPMLWIEPVAVDHYGSALMLDGSGKLLYRWSTAGGWRVLFPRGP